MHARGGEGGPRGHRGRRGEGRALDQPGALRRQPGLRARPHLPGDGPRDDGAAPAIGRAHAGGPAGFAGCHRAVHRRRLLEVRRPPGGRAEVLAWRAGSAVRGGRRPSDLTGPLDALTFGRLRSVDRLDHALLLLSIASSAAFMATRAWQPFSGSAALKGLAVAPLAILAFRVLRKTERSSPAVRPRRIHDSHILAAALALSCLGDVLLQLSFRRYFFHALCAFLLAHVAYLLLFTRNWPPLRPSWVQVALVVLVLAYAVMIFAWLSSALGRLLVPGLAYASALTAMTASAILAGFPRPFVWIGAFLFMISDSLLASGFKVRVPLIAFLIWPTYYLAQYGITIGFLGEKAADRAALVKG